MHWRKGCVVAVWTLWRLRYRGVGAMWKAWLGGCGGSVGTLCRGGTAVWGHWGNMEGEVGREGENCVGTVCKDGQLCEDSLLVALRQRGGGQCWGGMKEAFSRRAAV